MAGEEARSVSVPDDSDIGLDQAINDLRGVLKQDSGGLSAKAGTPAGKTGEDGMSSKTAVVNAPDTQSGSTDQGEAPEAASGTASEARQARPRRGANPANLDLVMDIPIDMEIVLGKSRLPVSGLMNLAKGSLIALDSKIGEPVDIMVNGRLFGRGEITVLDDDETRFGVRLVDIIGGD